MSLSTRYGIAGIGALAGLTVVQWLREDAAVQAEVAVYLLGVLPNLFAAMAITFVVLSFFADQRKLATRRAAGPWFLLAAAIAGAGLLGWEYIQQSSDRFVFDLHDIGATLVGLLLSGVVFGAVTPRGS
jgi:uncharacterized membrane protein